MCSYNCVIEKGFSVEEKGDFPILTVLVPISQGTNVTIVTEYVLFFPKFIFPVLIHFFLDSLLTVQLNCINKKVCLISYNNETFYNFTSIYISKKKNII